MIFSFIKNIFAMYFLLYILLSHSAYLTCRYGELKLSNSAFDWKQIDKALLGKCQKVSEFYWVKFFGRFLTWYSHHQTTWLTSTLIFQLKLLNWRVSYYLEWILCTTSSYSLEFWLLSLKTWSFSKMIDLRFFV